MRIIWLLLLVLFAVSGLSLGAGPQGIHEPGTGLANPELKEAAQGSGQGLEAKAESATNKTATSATQAQPGFEAALAALGTIVASFGLLCRKH